MDDKKIEELKNELGQLEVKVLELALEMKKESMKDPDMAIAKFEDELNEIIFTLVNVALEGDLPISYIRETLIGETGIFIKFKTRNRKLYDRLAQTIQDVQDSHSQKLDINEI